jgi:hypothetical protein
MSFRRLHVSSILLSLSGKQHVTGNGKGAKLFFFIRLMYYHTIDSEVDGSTKATRASDHVAAAGP